LTAELGTKLEDMVFAQLRSSDPDQISRYVNLSANVKFFSQLMGALSELRFSTITDRFISELRDVKGIEKQSESKLEMLVGCMKYLKLKLYPMSKLEDSADFLQAVGELFQNSHSLRIKLAFCELFEGLLKPVQRIAGVEVNLPVWQKTMEQIAPKVMRMVTKGRHGVSLQLMTTILSVSKREYFLKHWPPLIEILVGRLKEKKVLVTSCLCILLYVYLFRYSESPSSVVHKRIDFFVKLFFGKKRSLIVEEVVDVHSRIVYYIMVKYPEYGMEKVLKYLLNEVGEDEVGRSDNSIQIDEVVNAEGVWITIKAFSLFLHDVELSTKKGVHMGTISQVKSTSGTGSIVVEGKIDLPTPAFPNFDEELYLGSNHVLKKDVKDKMGASIRETMGYVNQSMGRVLLALERTVCNRIVYFLETWTAAPSTSSTGSAPQRRPSTSVVDTLNSFTGVQTDIDSTRSNTSADLKGLLYTILRSIPRFRPLGLSTKRTIEIIAKCTLNADPDIRKEAYDSLIRISNITSMDSGNEDWTFNSGKDLISAEVFKITVSIQREILIKQYSDLWTHGEILVEIVDEISVGNIELLKIWLKDLQEMESVFGPDEIQRVLGDLEAHGVLLLLSPTATQRRAGIEALRLVPEFRRAMQKQMEEAVETIDARSPDSTDLDVFERLSTFHGGKRASLYKRYTKKKKEDRNETHISIYDIMIDQGRKLVQEHYFDPLERVSKDTNVEGQRKRLQQSELIEMEDALLYVARSEDSFEASIWSRCCPHLLKYFMQYANLPSLSNCFVMVWDFLRAMHPVISGISKGTILIRTKSLNSMKNKDRSVRSSAVEVLIEHWKSFLTFAYTSIDVAGQSKDFNPNSEPFSSISASELHRNVLPFLGSDKYEIRKAVVSAIGTIPQSSYGSILGDIQSLISQVVKNSQQRISLDSTRKTAGDPNFDRVRTELTHLLSFLSDFTQNSQYRQQFSIMTSMSDYMRAMITFFNDPDVNLDWKHQMTRYYFCLFVEKYYRILCEAVKPIADETVEQYIPFKVRRDLFGLFESWCGFGVDAEKSIQREQLMMSMVLDPMKDFAERQSWSSKMEIHKKSIQLAALKAMASLCRGPLTHFSEPSLAFETPRITVWINQLLDSPQSRYRNVGRTAIENLLSSNMNSTDLFDQILQNCYMHPPSSNVTAGYFLGLVDLLCMKEKWDQSLPKIICLVLIHMSNENISVRKGAGRLLLCLDKHLSGNASTNFGLTEDVMGWYKDMPRNDLEDDAVTLNMDNQEIPVPEWPATIETAALTSSMRSVFERARDNISTRLTSEHSYLIPEV
jgi:hypothetical protein